MKKKLIALALIAVTTLTGCSAANVASNNISRDSDNFGVNRRIVFFNGITDTYLLEINGWCSITADGADQQLEVTCKTSPNGYKKHYLGLSDNVSYFVEQVEDVNVDPYHYKVIFRPETIVPDINLRTSGSEQ